LCIDMIIENSFGTPASPAEAMLVSTDLKRVTRRMHEARLTEAVGGDTRRCEPSVRLGPIRRAVSPPTLRRPSTSVH